MRQELPGTSELLRPHDYLRQFLPEPAAASDRLGWVSLEAVRYRGTQDFECDRPALTHHTLAMFHRAPDEMEMRCEGVSRHRPPPPGSVAVVPAGIPYRCRSSGPTDSSHVYLEPGLVARVAESFGLDPERWALPPLDFQVLPGLEAAMRGVDAELTSGDAGGPLAAESLANVLAVHLIRHALGTPLRPTRSRDGKLPRRRLGAVVEYVEEHLDASPTLAEMAAVTHLSPYHFARQFKATTGLSPHRYLLSRRVERAKLLLQGGGDLTLAQVAARAGFTDQSQFSRHFKRLVGVTPGRFRTAAGID